MKIKNYSKEFFAQIDVENFKKEIEDNNVVLIDVRTPEELPKYGKIREDQYLIDINNKNFTKKILQLDKSKKYAIYCFHGNRSILAREYMKQQGFFYVKDLEGGIVGWEKGGEKLLK